MQELSEVFWSFFISSCVGLLIVIGKLLYKSKCKEFNFCCIKIIRDTQAEIELDENPPPQNNQEGGESPRNQRV
jgi:hypothetical protein